MKATLQFALPRERSEHTAAVKGMDMFCTLWDFDQWLRLQIKHHDKDYDEIREKLHEFMNDHSVYFDDMQ